MGWWTNDEILVAIWITDPACDTGKVRHALAEVCTVAVFLIVFRFALKWIISPFDILIINPTASTNATILLVRYLTSCWPLWMMCSIYPFCVEGLATFWPRVLARYSEMYFSVIYVVLFCVITDHFRGISRVGPLCVCDWAITLELNNFWWNIFFGWLIIIKRDYYLNTTVHFYVWVSVRDLHHKKLVQFFFRFLPR